MNAFAEEQIKDIDIVTPLG